MATQAFLSSDPVQMAISLTPLTEFAGRYRSEEDEHLQSYARRYNNRYGSKFPEVEQYFKSEEDQYLFCAGHFYGEVGYRSHLFLPLQLCVQGAIKQKQSELVEYFLERGAAIGIIEFNLILMFDLTDTLKSIKKRKDFNKTDIYPYVKISSFETACELIVYSKYLFNIFRDRPVDEYPKLIKLLKKSKRSDHEKRTLNSVTASILIGQIQNGQKKEAKKFILELPPNGVTIPYLDILAHLDDLKTLKKHIEIIRTWDDLANLIFIFAFAGAINCLTWFLKEFHKEFEGAELRDDIGDYYNIFTPVSKIPKVVGLLKKYRDNLLISSILAFLCAIVGDRYLLSIFNAVNYSIFLDILLEYGHKDLFLAIYKNTDMTYIDLRIIGLREKENFFFCLENAVDLSIITDVNELKFTYPELKKILNYLRSLPKGIKIQIQVENIPTPGLLFELQPYLTQKNYNHDFFLTFPPVLTPADFEPLFLTNNVEYVEYLLSAGPINYFPKDPKVNIKTLSPEMRKLLPQLLPNYNSKLGSKK